MMVVKVALAGKCAADIGMPEIKEHLVSDIPGTLHVGVNR
jgi:hypothetical protein